MQVRDGYRQSVRSIVGPWNFIQPEQHAGHLLHLRFIRATIACNALFDEIRLVLVDGKARLR